jgi:tetraacyldisaccharide-1-P 4'-kinase
MARATEIILTRCDQVRDVEEPIQAIRQWLPDAPIRRTRHAPVRLSRVPDGSEEALAWLQKRDVIVACAIGHPEAFVRTLKDLGAQVVRVDTFPDHDAMSDYKWSTNYPTVITEKDAVRTNVNGSGNVYALRIALEDQEAE